MSPRTLYRSSGIALLLGSLSGLIWTIMNAFILPITDPNQFASLPFLITSLLMLFGSIAIVLGLAGLYARQATYTGWPGLLGFILIFLGMLIIGVGFGLISTTVIPWLTTHAPELIAGELPPVLYAFLIVAVLMIVVGNITLGIATIRARILQRWAGVLLILSGVTGLLDLAPLPPIAKNIIAAISAVSFFLGLAWLGYALLSEQHVEKEQAPVTSTEADDREGKEQAPVTTTETDDREGKEQAPATTETDDREGSATTS